MLMNQSLVCVALDEYRATGQLPDWETANEMERELRAAEDCAKRIREVLEACENHEASRRSPLNSLQPSNEEDLPAESND
jgi:hypothetical protein